MISEFWKTLGGELGAQWAATVLTPAFVFWGGGVAAWAWSHNRGWAVLRDLASGLEGLSSVAQAGILVGALLAITVSGVVAQGLVFSAIRLLEGYWPRWLTRPRQALLRWQASRHEREDAEFQTLAGKDAEGTLTATEQDRFVELDDRRLKIPRDPDRRMPTRMGNLLRAAEMRPLLKYGLDAVVCWPRLWLLLPKETKDELSAARAALDSGALTWLWGSLFIVWTIWAWWAAPLGVLVAFVAYRRMLAAADGYGQLVDAAFDVHRSALYVALRLPLPIDAVKEREAGEKLTAYLLRGSIDATRLTTADDGSSVPATASR